VVITSMGLAAAGNVGVLLNIDALKALGFPLGALLWLAAMVPFGVATARPAWWRPTSGWRWRSTFLGACLIWWPW
jgi:hypothetical protein